MQRLSRKRVHPSGWKCGESLQIYKVYTMSELKQIDIPNNVKQLFYKHADQTTPAGPISDLYPDCHNNCWIWKGPKYPNNPRGVISTYCNGKKKNV